MGSGNWRGMLLFQMGLQGKKSSSQEVEGNLGIKMWNCARSTSGRAGGGGGLGRIFFSSLLKGGSGSLASRYDTIHRWCWVFIKKIWWSLSSARKR